MTGPSSYRRLGRIVSCIAAAALSVGPRAEPIGRGGDDAWVVWDSSFVRKLLDEPVPAEVSRLFYHRAVIGISNDRGALARIDEFISHVALLKVAGLPPPQGATIGEVMAQLNYNEDAEEALRTKALERALAASYHVLAKGESPIPPKTLRIELTNTSPLHFLGLSALIGVRPKGNLYWVYGSCRDSKMRAPAQRWTIDCEAGFGGQGVFIGDAAFQALIDEALADWKRGKAEVLLLPQAIGFTERVPPFSSFSVLSKPSPGPGVGSVNLWDSSEAHTMAAAALHAATCEERGACAIELAARSKEANASAFVVGVATLGAFLVGLVLALPVTVASRRHAGKIGVVVSLGFIAAAVAALQPAVLGWGLMLFAPIVMLAAAIAMVGLWIGIVGLRAFFGRRDG